MPSVSHAGRGAPHPIGWSISRRCGHSRHLPASRHTCSDTLCNDCAPHTASQHPRAPSHLVVVVLWQQRLGGRLGAPRPCLGGQHVEGGNLWCGTGRGVRVGGWGWERGDAGRQEVDQRPELDVPRVAGPGDGSCSFGPSHAAKRPAPRAAPRSTRASCSCPPPPPTHPPTHPRLLPPSAPQNRWGRSCGGWCASWPCRRPPRPPPRRRAAAEEGHRGEQGGQ